MAVKRYKPTSPARRAYEVVGLDELTKKAPERSLLRGSSGSTGGRNNTGRITSRFRGGGHKQRYREIDWKRDRKSVV